MTDSSAADDRAATPIPRTLQLSLSGIRGLSVIEIPPRDSPAAVPVPAAVWLLGSGLAGLALVRRRQ